MTTQAGTQRTSTLSWNDSNPKETTMRWHVARAYSDRRRYLIVAAYATPNGPLHLGHLGGPYIRADALRRYLESRGHQVVSIGTSDSWESNVLHTALKEERPADAVVADYHAAIKRILGGFDLVHEDYLDIHGPDLSAAHRAYSDELVAALTADGRIAYREEHLLYEQANDRLLVGCWLAGRCPQCGTGAVGNSCEACGLWFGPLDMVSPGPRVTPAGPVATIAVTSAFAAADASMKPDRCGPRIGHRATYLPIVESYWKWNPAGIRLSYPIAWGLPWPTPELDPRSVHYSYGTLLWSASKLIGEAAVQHAGGPDPFSQASDTVTVAVGGIDAVMPWLVLLGLVTPSSGFRPYDFFVFNHFLHLHGAKFSTSRRHVIWAGDYLSAGFDTDCARLYLAGICPQTETNDFRCDTFASSGADWAGRLDAAVRLSPHRSSGAEEVGEAALAALTLQDRCMALPDVDIRAALAVLDGWLARSAEFPAPPERRWYLWCLAILAEPFIPRWSGRLWGALGFPGRPNVGARPEDAHLNQPFEGLRPPTEAAIRALMDAPSAGRSGNA